MHTKKAIVLFSGGQDSTTALFWARQEFDDVMALHIHYGQRHDREGLCAQFICDMEKIKLERIQTNVFTQVNNSALVSTIENINGTHAQYSNLPASFVPGRNIYLLTVAAMIAQKHGIRDIVTGVCQTDYSGYPDCREETILALEKALELGMSYTLQIHTPLMHLSKKETVELAQTLPGCMDALAYSHTCYEGHFPPCGKCPACLLRAKGFKEAGVDDPIFNESSHRKNKEEK